MNKKNEITQELLETIERFLNNTMEATEKIQFEKLMQKDEVLKQQVEDIKTLLTGIETASLREKMEELHQHFERTIPVRSITQNNRTNNRLFYTIAASFLLLLGIFWIFKSQSSNTQLFDDYFYADPGLPTTMGNGMDFNFYDGMVNYKRKEYDVALEKWKALLIEKNNNDTLNYFIGVTYLAQGNTEKAILFLEKVTSQEESIFFEDSNYYLGLSNLKNNNIDLAKENFRKSNKPESLKLLNTLEKK
ncbi:MAG: hypothetical protein R2776_05620 [Flavobacteriaceae bacterium]